MARYSWIYLITPFLSAVIAAFLARFHIKELTNMFNPVKQSA
jgi:glycerol uptake facilitator-like aquaporin